MTPFDLDKSRREIAQRVRQLRLKSRWTQAELARVLGLSQSRLSEIERGQGSFTAEQMFAVAKLFNVPVDSLGAARGSPADELHSALASLGANHLMARDDVLPSERLRDVQLAVKETLLAADPRQLAALAPVIVREIDQLKLWPLQRQLKAEGLHNRLGWLVQSIVEALRQELARPLPRALKQRYRRAELILDEFQAMALLPPERHVRVAKEEDVLDNDIMTLDTLKQVRDARSEIAARWQIVTRLQTEDFVRALEDAHEAP